MKNIKCYNCGRVFSAETREDMLNKLYSHYMEDHHEIITTVDEKGKKEWMDRFNADWSETKEA